MGMKRRCKVCMARKDIGGFHVGPLGPTFVCSLCWEKP